MKGDKAFLNRIHRLNKIVSSCLLDVKKIYFYPENSREYRIGIPKIFFKFVKHFGTPSGKYPNFVYPSINNLRNDIMKQQEKYIDSEIANISTAQLMNEIFDTLVPKCNEFMRLNLDYHKAINKK